MLQYLYLPLNLPSLKNSCHNLCRGIFLWVHCAFLFYVQIEIFLRWIIFHSPDRLSGPYWHGHPWIDKSIVELFYCSSFSLLMIAFAIVHFHHNLVFCFLLRIDKTFGLVSVLRVGYTRLLVSELFLGNLWSHF